METIKKKIELYVTSEMKEQIRKIAKKSGLTMTEYIKRILEDKLNETNW
jgi:predicted DNA-binding protein